MTPPTTVDEAQNCEQIDRKLALAGWVVQNKKRINLYESLNVTVREEDICTSKPNIPIEEFDVILIEGCHRSASDVLGSGMAAIE